MEEGELNDEIPGLAYDPAMEWPGTEDDHLLGGIDPSDTASTPGTTPGTPRLYPEASTSSAIPITFDASQSSTPSPRTQYTAATAPCLRLLVRKSSILPSKHTLAILDGYSEVQIGRDVVPPGSDTPRLRLKEMEVSKLHATVFWDKTRSEWAAVDMGSMHGTFVRSHHMISTDIVSSSNIHASTSANVDVGAGEGSNSKVAADPRGSRLSPPRVASVPRQLRHGDELSVGSTTFLVHLHESGMPCDECSPKGGEEIPLFDHRRAKREAAIKRKREATQVSQPTDVTTEQARDPKKAMTMLKRSLLSRHDTTSSSTTSPDSPPSSTYIDRSARRRALHTSTPPEYSPGVSIVQAPAAPLSVAEPVREPVSAPPTPLPSTNIGHRLLMKQGWEPGTVLGLSAKEEDSGSVALIEPLDIAGNKRRKGLGMPPPPPREDDNDGLGWRERGKFRRYADVQLRNEQEVQKDT
ncbi:Angiogenic factor with G patch and FHA domains 1 [Abortiporus biennis]